MERTLAPPAGRRHPDGGVQGAAPGYLAGMTEQPQDALEPETTPGNGRPEPADSPQRRLVESVSAFEVDPPAPARVDGDGHA